MECFLQVPGVPPGSIQWPTRVARPPSPIAACDMSQLMPRDLDLVGFMVNFHPYREFGEAIQCLQDLDSVPPTLSF